VSADAGSVYMLNKGPGVPFNGANVGGGTTVHMAQVCANVFLGLWNADHSNITTRLVQGRQYSLQLGCNRTHVAPQMCLVEDRNHVQRLRLAFVPVLLLLLLLLPLLLLLLLFLHAGLALRRAQRLQQCRI
jgi:hypothetical protein